MAKNLRGKYLDVRKRERVRERDELRGGLR
jgi:hypothetical protein